MPLGNDSRGRFQTGDGGPRSRTPRRSEDERSRNRGRSNNYGGGGGSAARQNTNNLFSTSARTPRKGGGGGFGKGGKMGKLMWRRSTRREDLYPVLSSSVSSTRDNSQSRIVHKGKQKGKHGYKGGRSSSRGAKGKGKRPRHANGSTSRGRKGKGKDVYETRSANRGGKGKGKDVYDDRSANRGGKGKGKDVYDNRGSSRGDKGKGKNAFYDNRSTTRGEKGKGKAVYDNRSTTRGEKGKGKAVYDNRGDSRARKGKGKNDGYNDNRSDSRFRKGKGKNDGLHNDNRSTTRGGKGKGKNDGYKDNRSDSRVTKGKGKDAYGDTRPAPLALQDSSPPRPVFPAESYGRRRSESYVSTRSVHERMPKAESPRYLTAFSETSDSSAPLKDPEVYRERGRRMREAAAATNRRGDTHSHRRRSSASRRNSKGGGKAIVPFQKGFGGKGNRGANLWDDRFGHQPDVNFTNGGGGRNSGGGDRRSRGPRRAFSPGADPEYYRGGQGPVGGGLNRSHSRGQIPRRHSSITPSEAYRRRAEQEYLEQYGNTRRTGTNNKGSGKRRDGGGYGGYGGGKGGYKGGKGGGGGARDDSRARRRRHAQWTQRSHHFMREESPPRMRRGDDESGYVESRQRYYERQHRGHGGRRRGDSRRGFRRGDFVHRARPRSRGSGRKGRGKGGQKGGKGGRRPSRREPSRRDFRDNNAPRSSRSPPPREQSDRRQASVRGGPVAGDDRPESAQEDDRPYDDGRPRSETDDGRPAPMDEERSQSALSERSQSAGSDDSGRSSDSHIEHFKWQKGMMLGCTGKVKLNGQDEMNPGRLKMRVEGIFGEGTFGRVLKCTPIDPDSNEPRPILDKVTDARIKTVALKVIRNNKRYIEDAKVEWKILKDLTEHKAKFGHHVGHRSIVNFLNTFEHKEIFCMAFEPLGLSLYELQKANNYKGYFMSDIQVFAKEGLEALAFMKSCGYTHTDLKPENVLLEYPALYDCPEPLRLQQIEEWRITGNVPTPTASPSSSVTPSPTAMSSSEEPTAQKEQGEIKHSKKRYRRPRKPNIKIIDFGGATHESDYHSSVISTRQYRASEVLLGKKWDERADVFSYGAIMCELYSGHLLIQTHDNNEHFCVLEKVLGMFGKEDVETAPADVREKFFKPKDAEGNFAVDVDRLVGASRKGVDKSKKLRDVIHPKHEVFLKFVAKMLAMYKEDRPQAAAMLGHEFLHEIVQE